MIDEAYAEFAGRLRADLERGYPRLVLVRTLSKAYALAGIRVGFAVAVRSPSRPWSPTARPARSRCPRWRSVRPRSVRGRPC